jgi:hypothetical protein
LQLANCLQRPTDLRRDIELTPSADGSTVIIALPSACGTSEIIWSVGCRWRKSPKSRVIAADRLGDVECRLLTIAGLLTVAVRLRRGLAAPRDDIGDRLVVTRKRPATSVVSTACGRRRQIPFGTSSSRPGGGCPSVSAGHRQTPGQRVDQGSRDFQLQHAKSRSRRCPLQSLST